MSKEMYGHVLSGILPFLAITGLTELVAGTKPEHIVLKLSLVGIAVGALIVCTIVRLVTKKGEQS